MTIDIVPIAAEHIEGFHEALDVVARERKYLSMLEAPPVERTRQFVLDNIAKGDTHLVAIAACQVVGWCDIRRNDRRIYAHGGVLGMGLLPTFRGQGLGKRLLLAAMDQAWKTFVRIELTVHADNDRAIALYARAGFKREGEMQDAALIDGRYKNVLMMAVVDRSKR
jgi:RimJ/RimL family protein N-acetyltransferase